MERLLWARPEQHTSIFVPDIHTDRYLRVSFHQEPGACAMKVVSIRRHLSPYLIHQRRATTVHHTFASAIAPSDEYEHGSIVEALSALGQDDPDHLRCVYCGDAAETWDHLHALVEDKQFSGYGHTLGNLVPACKSCNSRKGNKQWKEWLQSVDAPDERINALKKHALDHQAFSLSESEMRSLVPGPFKRLDAIKEEILDLMKKADVEAAKIREAMSDHRLSLVQ